jgi:D-alanyl-lipoteichoic acid acyltransferase DltB (MBOAT superfamily)
VLFNSPEFAIFFAVVLAAMAVSPERYRMRVLLAASLVFYLLWVPRYLALLLGTVTANYVIVRRMVRSEHPGRYLAASIVLTLSLLGVFKYGGFAVDLANPLLRRVLGRNSPAPDLVLPLGISFYTFELISLSVDIYRRRLPCPTFGRYVLFVTFFPHLIAGPIIRGEDLLPQLERGGQRTRARTRRGLWLIAVGLAKKAILSDFLLRPFVDEVFTIPGVPNGPAHLLAAYSFAFQIYFDFSGYSDMARGISCLLGFELPMNFTEPYLSRNPSELWRRWHMTLSRWLKDYLYIPLGGSRKGEARTHLNLMLTMLLGGLWHGAGLNFVIWGGLHGILLSAHRFFRGGQPNGPDRLRWSDAPSILLLFNAVCWIWVPFRASSWSDTVEFWRGIFGSGYAHEWPPFPLAVVLLCAALHLAERAVRKKLPAIHRAAGDAVWGPVLEGGALGIILTASVLSSGAGVEFIYFRF